MADPHHVADITVIADRHLRRQPGPAEDHGSGADRAPGPQVRIGMDQRGVVADVRRDACHQRGTRAGIARCDNNVGA